MTAGPFTLIYPMFALVLLSFFVLIRLFRTRVGAVRAGQVSTSYFRLYQGATEPETTLKTSRHFSNLFEAPTLFYVVCLAAMVTQKGGTLMQTLAWVYVLARIVHAIIHLGSNRLRWRVRAYFVSWLVLLAMWVVLVIAVTPTGGSY
ncbi:MAG: MAPEG family protein [Steroidobacteraceae bacterium]